MVLAQPIVEVAFGYTIISPSPVWTDITRYVEAVEAGITITRGAGDEQSETQPGDCSLVLDNDGRFTSGLTTGAYYPHIKKNVPLRVRMMTTAKNLVTNTSFEVDTADWSVGGSPAPALARSVVRAQHGTASGLVTWGTGGTPAVQITLYGLHIGTTYTASAYVWVPATNPAVRLGISGGSTGTASSTTDAWERIAVTFTATATSHTLQLTPATAPTSGHQVWVDSVQAEEGGSATAFDADGAQIHPRGVWMVNDWPTEWKGLHSQVSIACTDVFKWLNKLPTLQAMLVHEVLLDSPLAYYPMGEPEDSTSAGDLSGTTAGSLAIAQAGSGGTLVFGQGAGPSDGLGTPVFTPASSTAGKYLTADLGGDFETQSSEESIFIEAWFSTSTTDRVILSLSSTDSNYQIIFSLESGTGKLRVESTILGGPLSGFLSSVAATGNLADGAVHHLLYDEQVGDVYIDGTAYTVAVNAMFFLRTLTVGGYSNARLWSGTIAHVAVYADTAMAASALTTHHTTGTTEHIGETADDRAARLASYIGLTLTTQGTTFGGIGSQKALGKSPMDHLREVEATESGKLLASRSTAGLVLQSRDVRYNPVPAASLAYTDLEPGSGKFADDDQKMINTAVISRHGGATQRIIDTAARDTYGPYEEQAELFKTSDLEIVDAGNWLIQRYADPPPEIREVTVEGSTLGLAIYRALLGADISTALGITSLPAEAVASSQTVTVEGYSENIREGQHTWAFHTSRAQTDSVWVLDDATYSVLGTTTRLAY